MTVFNTGMTDLEKRKRYLMDLLAEKLKSSKMSNYFPFANYRTITVTFFGQNSLFFWFLDIQCFRQIARKKKVSFFFLFKFYFVHFLGVNEAQKRGLKIPTKIMDFLWNCKSSSSS